MKTSDRFNNAISALVKGFFNETLSKGSCTACAVGNICGGDASLANVFMTAWGQQDFYPHAYNGMTKDVIDATGYSWKDLAKVELAFETSSLIYGGDYHKHTKEEIMQDQYNGLMSVVEVLCKIEGIDTEETKEMFSYRIEENKPVIA